MRTDAHRPSAIVPSEYDFVSFDYYGSSDLGAIMALQAQREIFRAHMARTGGTYAKHENTGSCHICGAHAIYIVRWHHVPSNTYIQTGEDCARKMDMGMSFTNMNHFRRAIADAREANAGKRKAIALLGDANLMRAWEIYTEEYPQHTEDCKAGGRDQYGDDNGINNACTCDFMTRVRAFDMWEERTIRDIVGKLVRYGSISEKQSQFIGSLFVKIDRRPIIEAQRAAEREAAADCPTGRVRITGTVVGTKLVEDRFSYQGGDKMMLIIKDNSGFKVYGSRFHNVDKGDAVDFVATVTPSDKDAKFGFYKRPTDYVDKAAVAAERKAAKQEAAFLKTVAWG